MLALLEAEKLLAEQIRRYRESRSRREIFGGLRARHRLAYEMERQRREQQVIDEMYLSRLRFPPGESLPNQ
jgi:flagellar biosynthesis chaperone FliJ